MQNGSNADGKMKKQCRSKKSELRSELYNLKISAVLFSYFYILTSEFKKKADPLDRVTGRE
jgi:hypothetical protein